MNKIKRAAKLTDKLSFPTHAGHGLNMANVGEIASIPNIEELHIGHSIVARSIMVGFRSAVKEMMQEIRQKGA